MVNFLLGFAEDADAERGDRGIVTEEGNVLLTVPVPFSAGGVTGVTATAPLTSSGGAAPNIAATSPSRAYGQGSALTLTTAVQTSADAALVPSNTGKLQISAWCIVNNGNGEVTRQFTVNVNDGTRVLFASTPITIAPSASATFSVTFDSDTATGNGTTPHTYALATLATINLGLAELTSSTGDVTVAAFGSGIMVKENFN